MKLDNKNVLIVGLGKTGISTIEILTKKGANIAVYDKKNKDELSEILEKIDIDGINLLLGKEHVDVEKFDIIILSPGVPTDLPFIQEAINTNKKVIGELELAYNLCKGKFIAITGTNGKTTTTALTGEIFLNSSNNVFIVGNIGVPAISKALEANDDTIMVTEVSSFQLESIENFKPYISSILNITPDHLNRHKTMENYINAKSNIFKNQNESDYFVVNADCKECIELAQKCNTKVIPFSRKKLLEEGCFVLGDEIVVKRINSKPVTICKVNQLKIPGLHNLENVLAAVAISHWYGIDKEIIKKTITEFMGVEHRIEFVDEIKGVRFVNDSKGTNPDASIKAIEAIQKEIVLIAGGMDKGSDFAEFISSFNDKVKCLVLLGETAQKIKNTAEEKGFKNIIIAKDMEECVNKAYKEAVKGDTVLLSPACASWDMYPSFEVRGRHFKECVDKLRPASKSQ